MQSFRDQNEMYKIFNKLKPVMAICQSTRGPSYKCPAKTLYESIFPHTCYMFYFVLTNLINVIISAGPSGHAVLGLGLWLLAC